MYDIDHGDTTEPRNFNMTEIFFIGATGHIGGAVLDRILDQQPDIAVKALVRDEEKSNRLTAKYPRVQTVIGDLESFDKIEECSRAADVVINTAPDITHDKAIEAILRGLKARSSKGHYLHTSGASLIWDEPEGSKDARTWDDIEDIQDLMALNLAHTHSVTDRIVREAASDVHVAIIAPGFVGGLSPSLEHPTPITMPAMLLTARALKTGFQIAEGENRHAWIHVDDLAAMYTLVLERAQAGDAPAFGAEAYYFGTGEEIRFADFMAGLAHRLQQHGVLASAAVRPVSVNDAARASMFGEHFDADAAPPAPDSWAMHIAVMYGVNMRIRASRIARLGWRAERPSVVATLDEVLTAYLRAEKEKEEKAADGA